MNEDVTEAEARLALNSIEQRRQQVIAEIDVPPWYWISLAAGWIVLGVLAQYDPRGQRSPARWPSELSTPLSPRGFFPAVMRRRT